MGKRGLALMSLALLAGCVSGPVPVVYKTGSSFAERQATADQCRIESIEKIPQAMVTEYRPGIYRPGIEECSDDLVFGHRHCRSVSGFYYPGSSRTRDVNQELRERYIASCLRQAGFDVIAKPICSGSAATTYMATRDSQAPAETLACVTDDERVIPRDWR